MRVESNVIGKALKERTWNRDSRLHTFIIYYCVVKNPQCASVDDRMIIPPKERERKKKETELQNYQIIQEFHLQMCFKTISKIVAGRDSDSCTPMSVAACFTITKKYKQPKRPSTFE